MDRVAPERSEKFMVPPRLEYWMVILNLKSVASVKRTRLAANLFVDVITDRIYSDIEISSSNFIRTWNSIIIIFFYEIPREISKRFFYFRGETLNFEKICPKANGKSSLPTHRFEFLHFSDATSYVSTLAHSPSMR